MTPLTVLFLSLGMSSILDGVVAPFSESHPYNFLNPWIDPWWEELTKTEQKDIYAHWEKIQPLALALAKTVESKLRTKDAFKKLLHSKAEYLKEAVHLAFKAVKGDRDNHGKTEEPFQTSVQVLEEDLAAGHQELVHWKHAAKGAKKVAILEKLHLLSDKNLFKDIIDTLKKY